MEKTTVKTISVRMKLSDFHNWKKKIEAEGKTVSGATRVLILRDLSQSPQGQEIQNN